MALVSADIQEVEAATSTLHLLLRCDEGKSCYQYLDKEYHYLKPFFSKSNRRVEVQVQKDDVQVDTWLDMESYPNWLSRLVCGLARPFSNDSFNKCIMEMRYSSNIEVFEKMMPVLFFETVKLSENCGRSGDGFNAKLLLDCFSVAVRTVVEKLNAKEDRFRPFGKMLLSIANFLRTQVQVDNIKHLHAIEKMVKVTRKQAKSDKPSWHSSFWKKLDFLSLSKLSLQYQSYLSSLLYAESWREFSFGSVFFDEMHIPLETSKENSALKESRYILLEIFSNIDDPDSIYAVRDYHHNAQMQLRLCEHEDEWGKALGVLETSLQKPPYMD